MFFFKELSEEAKQKAIEDYRNAWIETQPNYPLWALDIPRILKNNNDLYEKDGTLIVDDGVCEEHDFPFIIGV